MIKVLGLGDNVVDINYTTNFIYPGGNSLNFSIYARELGYDSAYLGVLSNDKYAKVVTNALDYYNVDYSKCPIIEGGETGRCGIRLHNGDRVITEENFGGVVRTNPLKINEELLDYIKTFDVVSSNCFSYIEGQLGLIKNNGVLVVYDFSNYWEEDTFEKICDSINIAFFSGKDHDEKYLENLLKYIVNDLGCHMAITTIGKSGAIIYNGAKIFKNKPYNLEGDVVDTTGAGDSFLAGFLTSYLHNKKVFDSYFIKNSNDILLKEDIEDFYNNLIIFSMSCGNWIARKNCMLQGSFGLGVKF